MVVSGASRVEGGVVGAELGRGSASASDIITLNFCGTGGASVTVGFVLRLRLSRRRDPSSLPTLSKDPSPPLDFGGGGGGGSGLSRSELDVRAGLVARRGWVLGQPFDGVICNGCFFSV